MAKGLAKSVLNAARLLTLGTMMFLCYEVIGTTSDSKNSEALVESGRYAIESVSTNINPIISTVNAMEPDEVGDGNLSVSERTVVKVERHIDKKMKKELQCLATANYYEAGGEGKKGMMAVTQVIMNRMKEDGFPSTACGVISQRVQSNCQFSWMCSSKRQKIDRDSSQWESAYAVAEEMLLGGVKLSGMEKALFFHSIYDRPKWKGVRRLNKIGGHVFYTKI